MKVKGWVAMNKGDFDLTNMTFLDTPDEMNKWKGQEILEVEVEFKEKKQLKDEVEDER